MPTFFNSRPGSVVRLDEPAVQCDAYFGLSPSDRNGTITYDRERSIITQIAGTHDVNMQLMHTLGDSVYAYVFGDRIGQFVISGLSFCGCLGASPAALAIIGTFISLPVSVQQAGQAYARAHGLPLMMSWWERNKASQRALPMELTVGATVLRGLAAQLRYNTVDAEQNLVSWALTLATLPVLSGTP